MLKSDSGSSRWREQFGNKRMKKDVVGGVVGRGIVGDCGKGVGTTKSIVVVAVVLEFSLQGGCRVAEE